MSNLLLITPFTLLMVYLMADFHDSYLWYTTFCAVPIVYLCILQHLKQNNELNEEDDTYTF
jgi:hypothetical protein